MFVIRITAAASNCHLQWTQCLLTGEVGCFGSSNSGLKAWKFLGALLGFRLCWKVRGLESHRNKGQWPQGDALTGEATIFPLVSSCWNVPSMMNEGLCSSATPFWKCPQQTHPGRPVRVTIRLSQLMWDIAGVQCQNQKIDISIDFKTHSAFTFCPLYLSLLPPPLLFSHSLALSPPPVLGAIASPVDWFNPHFS